eukprot:GHVL01035377.1.p1 GENE.GHVL01035377.1~~GHVL01035377.1.p1  ORF type:complete len:731 (+),score=67.56 GHVL01035377.1:49-2241(+)
MALIQFKEYKPFDKLPPVLEKLLISRGWTQSQAASNDWVLSWKNAGYCGSDYDNASSAQILNHFQKSISITRKDYLTRSITKLQNVHGSIYSFLPKTFILPLERPKLISAFYDEVTHKSTKPVWICKPVEASGGKNICLIKDVSELAYDCHCIVQEYVDRPLLISGYKWDLRMYVLVTSVYPLRAFFFKEGLVRFATDEYDMSCLENRFSHLTNSTINKLSPLLNHEKSVVGKGCKWTFQQLRQYFLTNGIDDSLLWPRTMLILILTLLRLTETVTRSCKASCFELFGFDILVGDDMKPRLLEVNQSPSLIVDGDVDETVKIPLLQSTLNVVIAQHYVTQRKLRAPTRKSVLTGMNSGVEELKLCEGLAAVSYGHIDINNEEVFQNEEADASNSGPMFEVLFPVSSSSAQNSLDIAATNTSQHWLAAAEQQEATRAIIRELKVLDLMIRKLSEAKHMKMLSIVTETSLNSSKSGCFESIWHSMCRSLQRTMDRFQDDDICDVNNPPSRKVPAKYAKTKSKLDIECRAARKRRQNRPVSVHQSTPIEWNQNLSSSMRKHQSLGLLSPEAQDIRRSMNTNHPVHQTKAILTDNFVIEDAETQRCTLSLPDNPPPAAILSPLSCSQSPPEYYATDPHLRRLSHTPRLLSHTPRQLDNLPTRRSSLPPILSGSPQTPDFPHVSRYHNDSILLRQNAYKADDVSAKKRFNKLLKSPSRHITDNHRLPPIFNKHMM